MGKLELDHIGVTPLKASINSLVIGRKAGRQRQERFDCAEAHLRDTFAIQESSHYHESHWLASQPEL